MKDQRSENVPSRVSRLWRPGETAPPPPPVAGQPAVTGPVSAPNLNRDAGSVATSSSSQSLRISSGVDHAVCHKESLKKSLSLVGFSSQAQNRSPRPPLKEIEG